MENKNYSIKGLIFVLFIFNLLQFTFLLSAPFGGGTIFIDGIFSGILYSIYPKPSTLAPHLLTFINITTSIIYFGSLLAGLILPFTRKPAALKKKLILMMITTSIPVILIYLIHLFFPADG